MANIHQLPYFQINNNKFTNKTARYLLKRIKKDLKLKNSYHYLISARSDKRLKLIQKLSKKYRYFLRFDIEKYYPSINHSILLTLSEKEIFKNNLSRQLKQIICKELPLFLKHAPLKNRGLPLGNYLSWVLAGFYLLPLDFKIPRPFLRVQDDYLIFCKTKKEPQKILKEIIEPELNKLELKINLAKLNSGKFHENAVEFLGLKYYGGIFTINENKINEFKNKIIQITHLTKKKPIKAIIKTLNNKILGFGHYYKFASSTQTFSKLDAFIRQRLRRCLNRNKDSKNKLGNLIFTNESLKKLGLKSLFNLKEKYDLRYKKSKREKYPSKNTLIYQKLEKNLLEVINNKTTSLLVKNTKLGGNLYLKEILNQLEILTKKVNKIEKILKEKDKN